MFNPKPDQGPVAAAQQEIVGLFEKESELTAKRRELVNALAGIEANAGESFLDNGSGVVEEIAARVIKSRTEASVLTQAIEVARRRRAIAIRERWRVEADGLRREAAGKRSEAADILRKAEPLLKKLSDLEGVTFDASILHAQRTGGWGQDAIGGKPASECNPLELACDVDGGFAVPRSTLLSSEAKALEQRADRLEAQQIDQDGEIVKPNLQEILAELQGNPERLTPAVYAIEDWAAKIEARIQRERPDLADHDRRLYKLAWSAGSIDPDASSVEFIGVNYSTGNPVFIAA